MADKPAYHYTSVEALFQIVKSKRFRLSNIFFMNDAMEVEWCFNLAREIMLSQNPSTFAPLIERTQERGFQHVFCGCFSRLKDDLSQWRGYADDGQGVAIEVDVTEIAKANTAYIEKLDVIYSKTKQKAGLDRILKAFLTPIKKGTLAARVGERLKIAHSYFQLSDYAVRCKNPAFSSEKEVRLVLRTTEMSADNVWRYDEELAHKFPNGIDFRLRGRTLVPFVEIEMPLSAIRRIWLGPRFGEEMAQIALQLFLSKEGVPDRVVESIKRSRASYRG